MVEALAAAGCVAPEAEADELRRAEHHGVGSLRGLLARRVEGEPLPWVTGRVTFCGIEIAVDRGVFVPRPQTEALARRAVELLPARGIAVDLCTGSGAIAVVLGTARPAARVVATDLDPLAVACARRNGVQALRGDLDDPLPDSLVGEVDVVTAVVPYVPTEELHVLPRDVQRFEPRLALDGGPSGTALLVRAARAAARWLRPAGAVVLEIGGDQAAAVSAVFGDLGLADVHVHRDGDGRDRAIEARRPA